MNNQKITIIGLGYTGLPLLIEFFKRGYSVTGLDKEKKKIERLKSGTDLTKEVNRKDLKFLKKIISIKKGIKEFINWYLLYYSK